MHYYSIIVLTYICLEDDEMAFDGLFTHAMVHELNATLAGGRIAKINQPYPLELLMVIRANRHNYPLLLSANPAYPRVQITQIPYQNPASPSNFTMTMRKYLDGAIIDEIKQIDNDRIIQISFQHRDELGDLQTLILQIEIMARHSNIILFQAADHKIIDTIKHVGSDQNRVRTLLPGATFIMPPKQARTNPFLPNQHYSDLIRQFKDDPRELAKALQNHYQGFGPDSALELAHRLLTSDHLPSTYERFLATFNQTHATLYENERGKLNFAAFTPTINFRHPRSFESLSDLLDAFYADKAERDRSKELAGQVIKVINNILKKDRRKVKKLHQELDDAKTADQYRINGQILTTYLHQLQPGMTEIELPNFYANNEPITISLAPELSPSRNAQRYFTKYNKLKTSVDFVNEQLALTNQEIDYLTAVLSQIDLAAPADIQDIRLELQEQGYIKQKGSNKKQRKTKPSQPSEYQTSSGVPVLVGKNNRQNDQLTFKIANKYELWFHVKDLPGSHVVLRSTSPSDEEIQEAAEIAAYFSKGRDSSHVQVDYLPIKSIHKPSGARPGFVTFRGQTTLTVTPKLP